MPKRVNSRATPKNDSRPASLISTNRKVRIWPRACENSNSEIQSGESKPLNGLSDGYVGFCNPIKLQAKLFLVCYPIIHECQIVFTRPRPLPDGWSVKAPTATADPSSLPKRIGVSFTRIRHTQSHFHPAGGTCRPICHLPANSRPDLLALFADGIRPDPKSC